MAVENVATAEAMARQVFGFFEQLKRSVIRQIGEVYGKQKSQWQSSLQKDDNDNTPGEDIAFSLELDFSALEPVSAAHIKRAAQHGAAEAQSAITGAGFDFDVDEAAIAEGVGSYNAAELITNIDEPTRQWIASDIDMALQEGWSTGRLASELEDNYAFSSARADTIARTEVANADVQSRVNAYKQSGTAKGKRWLVAEEPCDICVDNESDDIIDFEDNFSSGDDFPPAHPNCECDFETIFENPNEDDEED